jgi:signal transduction histidine kinase
VTVYDLRTPAGWLRGRLRPTLRLRLTVLNAALLAAGAVLLLLVVWVLVSTTLAHTIPSGSTVVLANHTTVSADAWRAGAGAQLRRDVLVDGLLAVLALIGGGGVGAYMVAGRSLRPLQRVTTTARHLSGETLDQRIRYAGGDDEVAELAATFDAMLDRINTAFESQKRFVANASHELRTPLAVMRTEIDVTLADAEADIAEYRRMAKVVRDGSERANSLVDALLLLARSEAQAGRRLSRKQPVDLAAGVVSAIAAVRREADRMHLSFTTELEPASVVGDPGLLDRLAGNLIENAVRYNHLHGSVAVRTWADDAHAFLLVRNTGVEVEPEDVAGLFEPFRRGGWDRTGGRGSGLGLSIVRAVADAHGGTVSAIANADDGDGGLEVTVMLPAAATTPVVTASVRVIQPVRAGGRPADQPADSAQRQAGAGAVGRKPGAETD